MSIRAEMELLSFAQRLREESEAEEFAEQTRETHPEMRGSVVVLPNGMVVEI